VRAVRLPPLAKTENRQERFVDVIEALVAEVRITDHGLIPVFRIPGPRSPVSCSAAATAGEPPVRTMLSLVGLTSRHPNLGWLADGPEIIIRPVRQRRIDSLRAAAE
jgi:hypothetical protein